nr:reverse transcriptase domain-containing protein [Tanacetum cinerariifolium]
MPPRVMTLSARPRGKGTGIQVGIEGRRVREPGRRKVEPTGKLEGKGNDQGIKVNEGVDGFPDFSMIIAQQLQNLLPTMLAKEFLACNPKEYDSKGGAIVYTPWIWKMESVQDMSGCEGNQKVKYNVGSFVNKALTWWNSLIHTRGREAAI